MLVWGRPPKLMFVYRCDRIMTHFAAHMWHWIKCVTNVHFPLLFLVTLERWTGKSMADSMAFSHVITDELRHGGQAHSEPTRRGPRN